MSPAAILADLLAAARREGASFTESWPAALAEALDGTCEPRDWLQVLDGMAPVWRAAFEREGVAAPAPLYVLGEDRGVPIPERSCAHCGTEIPADAPACRTYCSRTCSYAAWRERVAA